MGLVTRQVDGAEWLLQTIRDNGDVNQELTHSDVSCDLETGGRDEGRGRLSLLTLAVDGRRWPSGSLCPMTAVIGPAAARAAETVHTLRPGFSMWMRSSGVMRLSPDLF
jgi:hypothetical protein